MGNYVYSIRAGVRVGEREGHIEKNTPRLTAGSLCASHHSILSFAPLVLGTRVYVAVRGSHRGREEDRPAEAVTICRERRGRYHQKIRVCMSVQVRVCGMVACGRMCGVDAHRHTNLRKPPRVGFTGFRHLFSRRSRFLFVRVGGWGVDGWMSALPPSSTVLYIVLASHRAEREGARERTEKGAAQACTWAVARSCRSR